MGSKEQLIFAFGQETGQSQVMAPLLEQLAGDRRLTMDILGYRRSLAIWDEFGLPYSVATDRLATPVSAADAAAYMARCRPCLAFTGASNPLNAARDLSSLHFRRAARDQGIPTLVLMDNWQGLYRWFASPEDLRPIWAPSHLGVLDEDVRRRLAPLLPESEVVTVGHPYLEKLWHDACSPAFPVQRARLRAERGIDKHERVVVLISQVVEEMKMPRRRCSLLDIPLGDSDYLTAVRRITAGSVLCVKNHPEEDEAARDRASAASDPRLRNLTSREVLAVADALIGRDSLMLVQGRLCGIPVLCLHSDADGYDQWRPDRAGLADRASNLPAAADWLARADERQDPRNIGGHCRALVDGALDRATRLARCAAGLN